MLNNVKRYIKPHTGNTGSTGGGIGGNYALKTNVYTKAEADMRYITIDYFNSLFKSYDGNTEILPNNFDGNRIDNIKANYGFWSNDYISALGRNSSGGGGGGGGTGSVTSVGILGVAGSHLTTSGSPITASGVINIGIQTGYSIPSTTDQQNWTNAATAAHSHSNKTILDGITATGVAHWNEAYDAKHSHNNIEILDGITGAVYLQTEADEKFITVGYFNRLFQAFNGATAVDANDEDTPIDNIKANYGFWSNDYISALGQNSSGGGGGGGGSVTSVGITGANGSHLTVTGSPITASGVMIMGVANGYSIPSTENQAIWAAAAEDAHSHTNKTTLDGITATGVAHWNEAYNDAHIHSNLQYLDDITEQKMIDWDDAADKAHSHSNKSVLDGITATGVAHWNEAYNNYTSRNYTRSLFRAYGLTGTTYKEIEPNNDAGKTIDEIRPQKQIAKLIWSQWNQAKNNAIIKQFNTAQDNYAAIFTSLTPKGDWSMGTNSTNGEKLYAVYYRPQTQNDPELQLKIAFPNTENGTLAYINSSLQLPIGSGYWQWDNTYSQLKSSHAIRIGDGLLSWDSSNNALKVTKYDGTMANFYSLGGISALGFNSGATPGSVVVESLNTGEINNNDDISIVANGDIILNEETQITADGYISSSSLTIHEAEAGDPHYSSKRTILYVDGDNGEITIGQRYKDDQDNWVDYCPDIYIWWHDSGLAAKKYKLNINNMITAGILQPV